MTDTAASEGAQSQKHYIEHVAHDEADGTAYYGPFDEAEMGDRLNSGYGDFLAQTGNLEGVVLDDATVEGWFINTREWWMEQEADSG